MVAHPKAGEAEARRNCSRLGCSLVVVILLWLVLAYNGLVRLRNEVRQGEASIDVQLKRRADLIPNLVNLEKSQ